MRQCLDGSTSKLHESWFNSTLSPGCNLANLFSMRKFLCFYWNLVRATIGQIALLYYFILLYLFTLDFGLSFWVLCVRCFFCYGSYIGVVVDQFKKWCIFLMYFMGNAFQTIYYFCKELHLRSYRVQPTNFSSFSQQFQVLIDSLYHYQFMFLWI